MTPLLPLTLKSIANRRLTAGLTVLAVALSVALLLGVERLRHDAREGFAHTLSGTDLVVGARAGPVALLLYSVFHIGDPTSNVDWKSIQMIAGLPQVDWVVPLSLGDSHRGFRVVGTAAGYFEHYRYGDRQALRLAQGRPFGGIFEAVVGAQVARQLGYVPGQSIVLAHGAGDSGEGGLMREHGDKPFTVAGVLAPTGTPVDRAVLVSLESIEAIHLDWQGGAPMPGMSIPPAFVSKFDLSPKSVTAALVGLKSRAAVFKVQRQINEYRGEPLLAVLPGVTLDELWRVVGVAEQVLLAISAFVVAVGLAGLVAVVVASLGERRRELAILRALGAGPWELFALLALESLLLTVAGCVLGLGLVYGLAALAGGWAQGQFGLTLSLAPPTPREWQLLAGVVGAGLVASLVPGWQAYRRSLADGMTVRI
jgi:putative ABC transport system permease protein